MFTKNLKLDDIPAVTPHLKPTTSPDDKKSTLSKPTTPPEVVKDHKKKMFIKNLKLDDIDFDNQSQ